jgi:hypothetical protein
MSQRNDKPRNEPQEDYDDSWGKDEELEDEDYYFEV